MRRFDGLHSFSTGRTQADNSNDLLGPFRFHQVHLSHDPSANCIVCFDVSFRRNTLGIFFLQHCPDHAIMNFPVSILRYSPTVSFMCEPKLLWHPSAFVIVHSTMNLYTSDFIDFKCDPCQRSCHFRSVTISGLLFMYPISNFSSVKSMTCMQPRSADHFRFVFVKYAVGEILTQIELAAALP